MVQALTIGLQVCCAVTRGHTPRAPHRIGLSYRSRRAVAERQASSPQLARDGDGEVACLAQVVEVLLEEPVLAIIPGSALAESREHRLGEDRGRGRVGP